MALKGDAGHWGRGGGGAEGNIINRFIWEGAQISIFSLKLLATSLFIVTCTLFTVDTITQDKGPVHAKPGFTINCKFLGLSVSTAPAFSDHETAHF